MNIIGWIGAVCFALCGLPQALKAFRERKADGLDGGFLLLWTFGEIFTLISICVQAPLGYLIFNYVLNLVFLSVIWFYWLKPAK